MNLTGNTVLITGGGSGIGKALAEMLHAKGNTVIVTGRNREKLDAVTSKNSGMKAMVLDVADPKSIMEFTQEVIGMYPALNVVIHNAGIMKAEKIGDGDVAIAEEEIATNLLGPIRLNSALLPHLCQQESATVMTVSSGLAFLPLSLNPTYCATKAAIHSYTQSLRYQLKDSPVNVIELVPPYVQTELTGERQANDPMAMPLTEFIEEVTRILENQPEVTEVLVERVLMQRQAEASGAYDETFKRMNDMMVAARTGV